MKQNTRDLGMAATVWVIAAVVVLALGRVDVPAGLAAGDETEIPAATSIEQNVPPAVDDSLDPEDGGQDQELGAADRPSSTDFVPLMDLPADDERLGSEPRAAVFPAERDPLSPASVHATPTDGGPASGHDAATDLRAAVGSPESEPEPEPELAEAKAESKPKPAEAKPKPAEPKPKPKPAESKAKPAESKPKPAESKAKPAESKPKPAEPKPQPKPDPKPGAARPKPEPAKSGSTQKELDQAQDRANR